MRQNLKKNSFKLITFLAAIGRPFFYLLFFVVIIFTGIFSLIQRFIIMNRRALSAAVKKIKNRRLDFLKIKTPSLIIGLIFLIFIAFSYLFVLKDLPSPDKLITRPIAQTTKIYDRHGHLLYKIYRQQNRTLVSLSDIPLFARQATIAIEDGNFYHHRGISLSGIGRAAYETIFHGQTQGGSTITQQLVKNALLTPRQTLSRKIKEIILAFLVETRFNKDEILQMYLNEVSYGGTAYGIEEASQVYFGKSARDLTLAEAALLAGLPASPTTFSPFGAHPELAKIRQKAVLEQMVKKKFITPEEAEKAKKEELRFARPQEKILAPHFVMAVKEQLAKYFSPRYIEEGGLEVITTLDLNLQEAAEKAVKEEINRLNGLHVTNGAALVTNPKTGEILAMVGSKDYFNQKEQGNFNVTTAYRQPGSAIKPINYAVALMNGFTLASIINDSPITYRLPYQPPYSPQNYDHRFHGPVTLRTALASSYNVPAVKILATLGTEKMAVLGEKMGLTNWKNLYSPGLSLTLGGYEVRMVDLAVAYGVFANQGKKVPLQFIREVKDNQGKTIWQNPCLYQTNDPLAVFDNNFFLQATETKENCQEEVLDPGIAFLITDVLADNNARAPAFGYHSVLHFPNQRVAVKTGTTNNLRDNWTIGYTPNILTAVWVGNNDNSPMSRVASGITGASPIWRKIMEIAIKKYPPEELKIPPNIVQALICPITGTLPCPGCLPKKEYFLKGTVPQKTCDGIFPFKEQKNKNYPQIL